MSLIHQSSGECALNSLDLFSTPPTQVSVETGQYEYFAPINAITDDQAPLEFNIKGSSEEYIDLSKTTMFLSAQVTTADGEPLGDGLKTGVINYLASTMFSQLDTYLNEKPISSSAQYYPYRAMIDLLLSYGQEAKKTQFQSALYFKDKAGKMDNVDPTDADGNTGLAARYQYTKQSRTFDVMTRVHSDIFMQDRYMLSLVDVKLVFSRSRPQFCMLSSEAAGDYKIKLLKAGLFVYKVKINPAVLIAHSKCLSSGTAKYPICRSEIKTFTIGAGYSTIALDHLILGQIPTQLVFCMVQSQALTGHLRKNPFNFHHFDLSYIALTVDGRHVPFRPLKPRLGGVGSQSFARAYQTLFMGTSRQYHDSGCDIDANDFLNGYFMLVYDLTPDMSGAANSHWTLMKTGSARLELEFATPLPETVSVIAYCSYHNLIEITERRDILFDYAS